MTEDPTFEPRNGSPTINVNVRTTQNNRTENDGLAEMERLWTEHAAETETVPAKADEEALLAVGSSSQEDTNLVYSSSTTIEYDVVKCEDYKEDKGCWIRNMPQEIKDSNPDFVPT
jgi:hypothetical protein